MPKVKGSVSTLRKRKMHTFHGFAGSHYNSDMLQKYVDITLLREIDDFVVNIDNRSSHALLLHPLRTAVLKVSVTHASKTTKLKDKIFIRVIGHNGNQTIALYQQENYNLDVTQCPYEILDVKDGESDLYIRYWMKLDSVSLKKSNMWRALFEYKTKLYDEGNGDGFRLIAFIYTDENDTVPFWHWQGDSNPDNPIWEIDNKEIPVPVNKWFLTEFYWHWSEGNDGRALWKIDGQVIGDHYGPTTRNSQPIDFIILNQIYGDSNPKHQWIDDIEIWDGIPK
jgi:hypothetical protein